MLKDITEIDLKILSLYIKDYSSVYSIMQITKKLGINYPNAFKRIKKLAQKGILIKSKKGQANEISLNLKNLITLQTLGFVEEIESSKVKNPNIFLIVKEAVTIDPFCCLGLFGSRVSKKETKQSDWDVFIITQERKEMEKILTKFPYVKNIQLQVFDKKEFEQSLLSPEETVVKFIVKNKQILFNPYPFYNIICKWEKIKYAPS